MGSANFSLISLNSLHEIDHVLHALLHDRADRLDPVELRLLLEEAQRCSPGRGSASPLNSLSTPARIRSSELLPEPFRPSTPILAP